MRLKKRLLGTGAIVGAALLLAAPAVAQEGSYVGIHGGTNYLMDSDLEGAGVFQVSEFDIGFAVGGVVGYKWKSGLRAEAEVTYRKNELDKLDLGFTTIPASDGDRDSLVFMANGFYDIDIGSKFMPYLGGGVGFAHISINDASIFGVTLADDSDTVFAFQLGGGVNFALSPRVSFSLDYRYLHALDPEFDDEFGGSFEAEYQNHTVMVTVRFFR